jgi:hypothetical protein
MRGAALVPGLACLAILTLQAQDRSSSPFSRDYKGGSSSSGGGTGGVKRGPASESKSKPGNCRAVVKSALDWLAKSQAANGHWESRMAAVTGEVVVTSFCALALMASGNGYREQVDKAAKFVSANLFKKGFNPDPKWDQTNWQIGIGSLFLCEYYADSKSADVKATLEQAVAEIFKRMEPSGGWGHCPTVKNALNYLELEIMSSWMLSAAGAAQKLGFKIPSDKVGRALKFIEDSCAPGKGGVGYSPNPGQKGMGCPGRTGGAIFLHALLNQKSAPLYPKMAEYWKQAVDRTSEGHGSLAMGYLGSALGARQMGAEEWDTYVAKFFPTILGAANGDGSFKHLKGKTMHSMGGDGMAGAPYSTGIYVLILQLDLGNLSFLGQRH